MSNKLYFGDNLHILRKYVKAESVDLIYLDPPFNSRVNYNILFKPTTARGHRAQIQAFDDTWKWSEESEHAIDRIEEHGGDIAIMISAFKFTLGRSDIMAYIAMMTVRLIELHRVLKPTGSLYLHCDPTACHYLKILLDCIFGAARFTNEYIWKRSSGKSDHSQGARHAPRLHDSILFYVKGDDYFYKQHFVEHEEEYVRSKYPYIDENGKRYGLWDMSGPGGAAKGNPFYEVMGVSRHWRYSLARMEKMIGEGRVIQPSPGSVPREKRLLEDSAGIAVGDIWTDINPINSQAEERIGYPTQKPVALLERILSASTKPGDVVLDPFCGCGTTVHAAQKLGREWIGIDITHVAIHVISDRLARWLPQAKFDIIGQPKDLAGAQALADHDKYQFQWWATWLCGGQPFGGEKKGKDRGVDGTLEFVSRRGVHEWGVISVKGGKTVNPSMIRDLAGTVAREKAALGVFLCIAEPSREMELEAVSAGFVTLGGVEYRKIQIRTIEQLLQGKGVDCPLRLTTAQKVPEVSVSKPTKPKPAKRAQKAVDAQIPMMLPISGGRKDDAQKALPLPEVAPIERVESAKRRKRG